MFNVAKTHFKQLSKYPNLRLGSFYELPNCQFPYVRFSEILSSCESGARPKGGINYLDEGQALSLGGEQIGVDGLLNLENIPFVSHEFYSAHTRGRVADGDILLCKDGALTGKSCIANISDYEYSEVMVNEHVYVIRPNELVSKRFLFHLMQTPFFLEQIKDLAFRKKGQPGLNQDHLKEIRIPLVPLEIQEAIETQILEIEAEASSSRKNINSVSEQIDKIVSTYIGIVKDDFEDLAAKTMFKSSFKQIGLSNHLLRFSVRSDKAQAVQKLMLDKCDNLERLGKYIIKTQNGWSPDCSPEATSYRVLGLDAIDFSTRLSLSSCKQSDVVKANLKNYLIKNGDLLISRGNTVDLVALASVASITLDDGPIVFPDLMIRISLDDAINPVYAACIFNSFIGRYFFRYAAKGKNQTMVKVSTQEVGDFLIPVPPKETQLAIAKEVSAVADAQDALRNHLTECASRIMSIITKSIW